MIAGGLCMFTYKSTDFNLTGFLMVLGAAFLAGIRWTYNQMLMQKMIVLLLYSLAYYLMPQSETQNTRQTFISKGIAQKICITGQIPDILLVKLKTSRVSTCVLI
jgi:hypothetical protein